ncbi:PA2779 family protein [Halomonas denitrificans]|nr:PA2779 family protein [Halomonas denitrificans]
MISTMLRNTVLALALAALVMPAQASLISTGDALAIEQGQFEDRIEAYLLRDDVAAELSRLGVSHEVAMARVARLSPAEVEQLADGLEDLPAGEGVVVIAGVVFIVLLLLEAVGVTDIFKST